MTSPPKLVPWLFPVLEQLEQAARAGRLGHGWLISGPRGIGKLNLAVVLATRILEHKPSATAPDPATPEDLLSTYADREALTATHPDLHHLAPEEGKQAIAVDQVRAVIGDLALTSLAGGAKVVIIERADRMTREAANALLKSLEEPAGETYLLLLAERPGRLPATIRSRCQQMPLRLPAPDVTRDWLAKSGAELCKPGLGLSRMAPIRLAQLLMEDNKSNIYNGIYNDLESISRGKGDPLAIAESWQKEDAELAISCLIDSLRSTIRHVLVPGHTNRITDGDGLIMDNCARHSSIGSLFEKLNRAENLREQIGRGTNIELALKALLLGLDVADEKRLKA